MNRPLKNICVSAVWPYVHVAMYTQSLFAERCQFYVSSHPLKKAQFEEGKVLGSQEDIAVCAMLISFYIE